jgi:hypothetical protein
MFDGVGAPIPGTLLEIRQADSQGPVPVRSRGGRTRTTSRIHRQHDRADHYSVRRRALLKGHSSVNSQTSVPSLILMR